MRLRSVVTLFAALPALLGVGAAQALAADPYPPAGVVCSITPDPVYPKSTVTITCTGYAVGSTVTFTVVTNGEVTTTSGVPHAASGSQTAHATVPASGTVVVNELSGPQVGPATFEASGPDTNGATQVRQITTHVIKKNSNGNGNGNGKGCTSQGSVSTNTTSVGQTVTITGSGFAPNTPVVLTDSAGNDLGSTTSDSAGNISAGVAEGQPGKYTIYATGKGGGDCVGKQRTVVAGLEITRAEGAGLPFTGMDGLWLLLFVAIVLVAGGSGVVALERRRRLVRAHR